LPTEKLVCFIEHNNINSDISPLRLDTTFNNSFEFLTDINNPYLKLF